jgi:nitrogen PTS system EIIA component
MFDTLSGTGTERPVRDAALASMLASICPREIELAADVRDKHQALELAASLVHRAMGIDQEPVFRALARREQAGSTAIGCGIAIPHARISGVERPVTVFLRPSFPIPFDAPDGKPVSALLAILVPADDAVEAHLQLLAKVAEIFADRAFRMRIADAAGPTDIREAFAQWLEAPGGVPTATACNGA